MPITRDRSRRQARRVRTRLDPEVRRELIIDAAEGVLADRDPTDLTFEQVSVAAGVSRGLIYNYFGDKGGLLAAVYLRNFDRLVVALEDCLRPGGDPLEQRVRDCVEVFLRFAADNPNVWKLVGTVEAVEHPHVRRARRAHIARIAGRWGDTSEARVRARGVLGLLEGATTAWLDDGDLPIDQAVEVIHAQMWSGLADEAGPQEGRVVSTTRQQYHATTLR
jgi:AcrR family transcriptional regulator